MADTLFCPNCGERISARARFCPSCGARQEDYRVAEPAAAAQPDSPPPTAEPAATESPPAAAAPPEPESPPAPEAAPAEPEPPPVAARPTETPPEAEPPSVAPPRPEAEPPPAGPESPAAAGTGLWAAGRAREEAAREAPPPHADEPPPPHADEAPPPRADGAPPPRGDEAPAPSGEEPPAREGFHERIGRVDPQAGELSGALHERLAAPGMVAAGLAALAAAGAVLAAGVVLAAITPDNSILGFMGQDAGFVTEAFRQAVGTLLVPVVDAGPLRQGSSRLDPLLLLVVPLAAVAAATRWQLPRTEGAAPRARLAWAAAAAVPFAVLMLAFAILGGRTDSTGISPSAGAAFGLGLLWGVAGALIGARRLIPRPAPKRPTVTTLAAAAAATLRPLAAVVATCTVIGAAGWVIQVARGVDDVRIGRSAPTAVIEEAAFAGEHGIHLTALSAGARFHADSEGAIGLPFPVEEATDVPGPDGALRIFSYDEAVAGYLLLPALVVLLGLLALSAVYAGFAAARAAAAPSLAAAAAWGALTGPVWAVAMAILVALAGGVFHGDPDSGSVFAVFLLGGAVLGAAGGALAPGEPQPVA